MGILREQITAPIFSQATLGKRSEFDYTFENEKLLLRFGKMNYFLIIKKEIIDAVQERINQLKDSDKETYKQTTSLYNKPKWQECPNNRFCVYVACLLIHKKIKV
jgi:hypothetical protein